MYSYYSQEMMPYQYGAIPELNPIGASPLQNSYGPSRIDPSRQVGTDVLSTIGSAAGALNPVAGAAVGFLGNVVGKGLDYAMQGGAQKSLMNYQQQLNSPAAMMSRMHDAGINPAAAAQGIAGAPGAGAVAGGNAPMSQGTPNLLDILANSENTALNAQYLRTQNEQMKVATEGMRMDNKMKAIETGTYGEYRNAEINDLIASANEKAANIGKLNEEKENLIKERRNIEKTYDQIVADIGETDAKARLENSEKALKDIEKRIQEELLNVGYAPGTPEYNLTKAASEAAEKGIAPEEYAPYKAALSTLYDSANATARGQYESDPEHQKFRELKDAQDAAAYLNGYDEALAARIKDLKSELKKHSKDSKTYKVISDRIDYCKDLQSQIGTAVKNADKAFRKESYRNGYHTQWQNAVDAIAHGLSQGLGIGLGAAIGQGTGNAISRGNKKAYNKGYDAGYYEWTKGN